MDHQLSYWTMRGIPEPVTEFRFHPKRKWRFDYAWISHKIALEVEGGAWTRGRHTRGAGFLKDCEKYNMAGKMGWRIFRFTPTQVSNDEAALFLMDVFKT
jgi:very-short-patch-repair endonuclease